MNIKFFQSYEIDKEDMQKVLESFIHLQKGKVLKKLDFLKYVKDGLSKYGSAYFINRVGSPSKEVKGQARVLMCKWFREFNN